MQPGRKWEKARTNGDCCQTDKVEEISGEYMDEAKTAEADGDRLIKRRRLELRAAPAKARLGTEDL